MGRWSRDMPHRGWTVYSAEIDQTLAHEARLAFVGEGDQRSCNTDFLEDGGYGTAASSWYARQSPRDHEPAYANGAVPDHVLAAWHCLKPGGRLVAILPPHGATGSDHKHTLCGSWSSRSRAHGRTTRLGRSRSRAPTLRPASWCSTSRPTLSRTCRRRDEGRRSQCSTTAPTAKLPWKPAASGRAISAAQRSASAAGIVGSFCPHTDPAEQRPPELVTYAKVRERDRVRLIRDATRFTQVFLPGDPPPPGIPVTTVYPAGRIGVVTMKAKDGISGKPIVRVWFPGLGEPWFDFPPPPGLEELAYV